MTYVGITGHQRLEAPEKWSWVARVMNDELENIAPPLIAVASVAQMRSSTSSVSVDGGALSLIATFAVLFRVRLAIPVGAPIRRFPIARRAQSSMPKNEA